MAPQSTSLTPIEDSAEWRALQAHCRALREQRISDLFRKNGRRFDAFSLDAAGLLFDFSKHFITAETLNLLGELAHKADVPAAIKAMFAGEAINVTERRPALHVALRQPQADSAANGEVQQTLKRMADFVDAVHGGRHRGFSGRAFRDVVNIGIGGSDLGPAMAHEALAPRHVSGLRCHYVSNVDPCHIRQTLAGLNPETTLFIISSKSFTTLETAQNAELARAWVLAAGAPESDLAHHFVAVSTNVEKAEEFGIARDHVFPMWDWVGGRYSLWSAIGLSVALAVGMDGFRELLDGAHAMDEHFRTAAPTENMPVLMALLAVWYLNFFGAETQVVLPYCQNLHLLPAFLQQLDMESLGKSVRRDGSPHALSTGGILWGSAGTNGQHSFHQLLHQGTHLIPADFIAVAAGACGEPGQHRHLLANCLAQSQALMNGKTLDEARRELIEAGTPRDEAERLAPHKVIAGNKPSSTIVLERLTPYTLGSLIAAYEHKVYVQGAVLQINPFDQWGVELGKVLSRDVKQALDTPGETAGFDASSNGLINYCKQAGA